MKFLLLLLSLVFSINLFAQTPNYVPTNGLIGWYPFNGNANDGSGNAHNATNNTATLTNDRFGNANSAYSFNGTNSKIDILNFNQNPQSFSTSLWFNAAVNGMAGTNEFLHRCDPTNRLDYCWNLSWGLQNNQNYLHTILNTTTGAAVNQSGSNLPINTWIMATMTFDGNYKRIYLNGAIVDSANLSSQVIDYTNKTGIFLGYDSQMDYYNGKLDDIGIWNRALSKQEITGLYNSSLCTQYVYDTITTHLYVHDTLTFHDTITAHLYVHDTITTHDTITHYLAVTDTLIINAVLTGINPPNNINLIKVFPNPAKDHITINFGNYSSMNGYSIKITNSLSQIIYSSLITQQQTTLDLSTWSGKGTYFIQVLNGAGTTIETRKIILQ